MAREDENGTEALTHWAECNSGNCYFTSILYEKTRIAFKKKHRHKVPTPVRRVFEDSHLNSGRGGVAVALPRDRLRGHFSPAPRVFYDRAPG
ncbi:hypothetical protein EVAR_68825_1 [Eumeta japonica]|uniref:Uncharacterized protein n=1 Tax=Eumeta variegata TaxID=151549 RepID=A0A4C1ZXS5_EUMVA|nr:hypothetical protein EVAR_68825_1 [Eumeta japonica]